MKRSDYTKQWCMAMLSALLMVFLGCSRKDIPNDDGGKDSTRKTFMVKLNLSVNIAGGRDMRSRAGTSGEVITTPGTQNESTIKSITVFMVDLDNEGNEKAEVTDYATFHLDPARYSGDFPEQEMEVSTGKKHIYIGANLRNAQIVNFASKLNQAYTVETGTGYVDHNVMMEEFVGKDKDSFSMFGLATQDGNNVIEVKDLDEEDPKLNIAVNLTRMTAKVLVTVTTEDNIPGGVKGVEYANLKGEDGQKSWIRLENIWFRINVANRKTYLFPKEDESLPIDPNPRFEDLITYNDNSKVFEFKDDAASREFVRWMPHIWNQDNETWGMNVLKYDKNKVPATDYVPTDPYTEGIYCLENTVNDVPTEWASILRDNKEGVTLMATTYVLVAAKVTPRHIITKWEEDPACNKNGKPYVAENEDDAKKLLEADTDNPEEYPEGTFYTIDRKNFYSYDGMMSRIAHDKTTRQDIKDKVTRESFVAYPGGWGYHFTYLDGEKEDDRLAFDPEKSSVLRNHYYILNVEEFSTPPLPGDFGVNTMQVEVKKYGWEDAGTGDITLKP